MGTKPGSPSGISPTKKARTPQLQAPPQFSHCQAEEESAEEPEVAQAAARGEPEPTLHGRPAKVRAWKDATWLAHVQSALLEPSRGLWRSGRLPAAFAVFLIHAGSLSTLVPLTSGLNWMVRRTSSPEKGVVSSLY